MREIVVDNETTGLGPFDRRIMTNRRQWPSSGRAMGRYARALTGLACKRRGKKRSPHSGRVRNSMGDSRAPFRASPIVAEKTRPQGVQAPRYLRKDGQEGHQARRSFAHHVGLSNSPRLMINLVAATDSIHLRGVSMRETRAGHRDDVGGAGGMKARRILTNITDLVKASARETGSRTRPSGPRKLR
jgi:hypothetical protein